MDPWGQGLKGCHSRSAGSTSPMSWSNNLEQYQWTMIGDTGWRTKRKNRKLYMRKHLEACYKGEHIGYLLLAKRNLFLKKTTKNPRN